MKVLPVSGTKSWQLSGAEDRMGVTTAMTPTFLAPQLILFSIVDSDMILLVEEE